MSDSNKKETAKGSWWKGLQAEFRKITWLDKVSLGKQTLAVIIVSVILGVIIAVLDLGIQQGIDFLVNL